ncbi:MAG: hypothetical protein MSG64_17475 [Pyrinomonadaceae bacterium MAG19_C2-C3]|nr:hypothetical protein [Pyrinomonadaceae bacterium MAG19_C2-C3]
MSCKKDFDTCWCAVCRKLYDAARWQATKDIRRNQKKIQVKNVKAWFFEMKSKIPCSDCSNTVHPAALQFDHPPGAEKIDNISNMVESGLRLKALHEIEKCQPVCANCHAVRTYTRRRNQS